MHQQRCIAAVVQNHVGELAVGPLEDAMGEIPVLVQILALVGEDRSAARCDGGGGMILRRKDVARGPAHIGAQRLQRLDEDGGLDRHVQAAGDARATQRLLRGELLADRHQAGHLGLGDGDLFAPPVGQREIGHAKIGEVFGQIGILGLQYGAHHALLSVKKKVRERRCKVLATR
jgi:hypothetical protein